jgi:hypothetical protein
VLFLVFCCLLRTSLFLGFVFLFFVRSICAAVLKPPSSVTAAVFCHWLVHRSHLLRRSFSRSCSRSGQQLRVFSSSRPRRRSAALWISSVYWCLGALLPLGFVPVSCFSLGILRVHVQNRFLVVRFLYSA